MNRILRTALLITSVVGFSGAYVSNALWACEGCNELGEYSKSGGQGAQVKTETKGEKTEAVKDPVCNMKVSDVKKASSEEYQGKVYYFCSEHCKKAFKKDPAAYISKEAPQPGGEGHKH